MRGHRVGQMRKGGHVVQRRRDFGGAAEAVAHHAVGPGRIGGAGAHDAGNLFGQGAGARRVRARGVEVIERWRCAAEACHGGGKARLVRGIVGREQQIGFRQILHMDEAVGRRKPRLERRRGRGCIAPSASIAQSRTLRARPRPQPRAPRS